MSYEVRSKQFDWFKNSNQIKKPKKAALKTIWKFLKIFIYLSLFVFSMIGCVQSFVIKTNNFSGQAFEIYESESVISPHVTQIKINKTSATSTDQIINDSFSVSIQTDSNIYINDKSDTEMLKNIHETIQNQNQTKNLKLLDAWKGVNEGFRFESNVAGLITQGKVHKFNDNYAVLSSKADNLAPYNLGGNTNFTAETIKLWIPTLDTNKKTIGFKSAGINFYKVDKDFKPTTVFTTEDLENDTNPRNLLRRAILNQVFSNNDFASYITQEPTGETLEDKMKFNNLQRIAYGQILTYLGIQDALDVSNKEAEFKVLDNYMLAMGYGQTGYYPIVNWNSAWSLGPFYGLFVYPIGKVFTFMLGVMPLIQGWEVLFAIILIVVISRIIAFLLSFKSTLQQTKMQELNAKKAIIDAKYDPYKGNKQMENRKRQEVAELYKKAGINPLGALGTVFVTMPLFLALWRVIGGVQQVKATIWLGINFSATSYSELFLGHFQYLPLMLMAALVQLLAQIYPRILTRKKEKHQINVYQKAAMKKNNRTQNIMMGSMVFLSLIFSAGIQIYWIIGGLWRIFEVYITHKILHRQKKMAKVKKSSYQLVS